MLQQTHEVRGCFVGRHCVRFPAAACAMVPTPRDVPPALACSCGVQSCRCSGLKLGNLWLEFRTARSGSDTTKSSTELRTLTSGKGKCTTAALDVLLTSTWSRCLSPEDRVCLCVDAAKHRELFGLLAVLGRTWSSASIVQVYCGTDVSSACTGPNARCSTPLHS